MIGPLDEFEQSASCTHWLAHILEENQDPELLALKHMVDAVDDFICRLNTVFHWQTLSGGLQTHWHRLNYEDRSINKLQNSIILVTFKVWKIQIYILYGILCWLPAVSFITMTSLWRHLSTLNAATLPFKVSRNEQYSVIRFPWAKASAYAIIRPPER